MKRNSEKQGGAVIIQLHPQMIAKSSIGMTAILRPLNSISYFTIA